MSQPSERVRTLDEHQIVARAAAAELGETGHEPRLVITRLAKALGVDFVRQHVERAKDVESQGGLLCADGTRRTLGGVFFFLVKQELGSKRFNAVVQGRGKAANKTVTAAESGRGSVSG
jgi:hypothetical protein